MQDPIEPISKSQKKREMLDLQALGEDLVALSSDQLKKINLPEKLLDAVKECKRLTQFGAIRRQMQYIGKIMRDVDPAPIQTYLSTIAGANDRHTAWLHQLERWRERLLADDHALQQLLAAYPDADIQQLRTTIRNSRKERAENKPPKHFRALFQELRQIIGEPTPSKTPYDDKPED